jgi:hypothetical protein
MSVSVDAIRDSIFDVFGMAILGVITTNFCATKAMWQYNSKKYSYRAGRQNQRVKDLMT